ncbi:LytTR family DNA-binding domain-containing protein [Epilithonimonas ginsengisoli]|uniref:LytTR family DNA-binding domain-containing protein n=1 Tax=Epilithonimonas ginsengisoli TaxID=1245592 RepID=A0ABU4JDK3_9FLAO|nr:MULTISPECIES: LytTR family DNA-binding domain-containing protein [Chryseobacterium group]MBV6878912.1 LytTR family DNA-binding domain-containing protein [Epilithonimonas sp. FP105]MDW8547754.1 LytTR family DNA-binding domain-containing protein [Epilithonimonas ginsengisoli]OAH76075.1 two-component system response regulator [Chryseobacterium sp. FP211-J200]
MKTLIVDDNDIARTTLAHLAKQVPNLTIVNEYSNAIEAYNHLQNNQVDLIFLDIEMPEMTGIELTKNLSGKDIIIIFTSSNKDYALEAFELNIADYILKPVMPARFLQAVSKAQSILESRKEDVEVTKDEFLFVRDSNITRRLKLDDIFYAEALGDYVKFYTREKMFAIHGKMKTAEERLPKDDFIRVHRSFIIAVNKIDTLQDGGIMINGKFIPVADAYRKALNTRMNVF